MQDLSQMEWQREHRTPYQISLLRQPYMNKISFKFLVKFNQTDNIQR